MGGKVLASAAAILAIAVLSFGRCPAGESAEYPVASAGDANRNAELSVRLSPSEGGRTQAVPRLKLGGKAGWNVLQQADAAARRIATAVESANVPEPPAAEVPPAVSLDRRVPAAQPNDREGLSLVGVLGAVGEIRHAFSRDRETAPDAGVARIVRTLRDSVLGKRISILSESGHLSDSDPYLVGLSFTH